MSGLNFVKSNKEIDSMMLSPTSGKIKDEKKVDNNLGNISMDTPMDSAILPSSSNVDSERRVFSTPPPHPVAAQHYYRKLFSDQQEPIRNEEQLNDNSHPNNNNFKSNNAIYPSSLSGAAGFITPYAQPIYTMMAPQAFQPYPASYQPTTSVQPTISSIVTDSLLSLIKYLIFFLLSLGIFKVGKRWILSLLKNYRIIERVPSRKESELVVKPEIKLEKREEEEYSNINESEPREQQQQQQRENVKPTSGESTNPSLDFNSMMFLQREIFDLKLSLNEMKTKMGEMNNQAISNTLLKQMELQQEQQKMILSQTLSKNDKSTSSDELHRELNNLRNDLSQMKGMMMVNHQPYTVAPPIIHREPVQYYPKYSTQSVSPATSSSSNENKLIEHNLTSSIKTSSPPTRKEGKAPSPVNYLNSYSTTDPTNYESGISKRSQPSIEMPQQPTEEKTNSAQEATQEHVESKTTPTNEEKTDESQFEYGQKFEPITEEEYDQVYGEYLNSLGKRFEDQVNFHTHAEPTPSETKTENATVEETIPVQESNPVAQNNENNSLETETPMTSNITTSKPFDEVDVFNILKTPTLSFDELFVKASPKQPEASSVFNDVTSPSVSIENNNAVTESSPSFVTPQASSSIQEAARELRKTQLTAKQKKSKIFGVLLAPEKKTKKKRPAKTTTPETQEAPKESTPNTISIETSILSESEKSIENSPEAVLPVNNFAPEIPISMNTLSNPIIDPPSTESFEKFETYNFENDERFQRMLSLTADDEDCPINKDDPNFLLMQKGIYFKQLLGNDDFDLEAYMKVKGIEINQQNN